MIYISGDFNEQFVAQGKGVIPVKELLLRYTKDDLKEIGMDNGRASFPDGFTDYLPTQIFAGIVELETTSRGGMACDSENTDAELNCAKPHKRKGLYALFGHNSRFSDFDFYVDAYPINKLPEKFRDCLITEVKLIQRR